MTRPLSGVVPIEALIRSAGTSGRIAIRANIRAILPAVYWVKGRAGIAMGDSLEVLGRAAGNELEDIGDRDPQTSNTPAR